MNNNSNSEASPLSAAWVKYLESPETSLSIARMRSLQLSINHFDRVAENYRLTPALLTPLILSRYRGYLRELGLISNTIYRHVKNLERLQAMAVKMVLASC